MSDELTWTVAPGGDKPPVFPEIPGDLAPDAPPVKSKRPTTRAGRAAAAAARAPRDSPPKSKPASKTEVAGTIATLHVMIGGGMTAAGLPATGGQLVSSADEAGKAWAAACVRYPRLAQIFGAGTDGLVLFRLAMIYLPIILSAVGEANTPKSERPQSDPLENLMRFATMQTEPTA